MMHNTSGLEDLMQNLNKIKKDLNKSAESLTSRFSDIAKKFDFLKEKKTKLNKMPATMFMNIDKSILITFDDPNDSDKFFGK